MNTLERLKELQAKATPGPCVGSGAEILPSGDLRYYIDFPGIKTGSVAGSIALGESINALPALLEVAEAAKWVRETTNHAYVLNQAAVKGALKRLDAALANLEG